MEYKIEFKWIPPSKKNSRQVVFRKGRVLSVPSKAYSTWHSTTAEYIKWIIPPIKNKKLKVIYKFLIPLKKDWEVSGRPFDFSNKIESINDFLVDMGILEDDNYTIITEIYVIWEHTPYWEWGVDVILIIK